MTVHMDPMIPLTPEESLYAFMDGELDTHHEQPLFDALAADTALRGEMKDLLAIRSAVQRDTVVPPADVESRIIAGVGLPMTGATTGGLTTTTTLVSPAAGRMSALLTKLGIGIGGLIAGIVLTYVFIRPGAPAASPVGMLSEAVKPATPAPSEQLSSDARSTAADLPPVTPPPPTIVYIYRDRPAAAQSLATTTVRTSEERPIETSESLPSTAVTLALRSPTRALGVSRQQISQPVATAPALTMDAPMSALQDLEVRVRSIPSGLGRGEDVPPSIAQALMPNQAFSMSVPLGNSQRIGLELASESFQQRFDGMIDGRSVTYMQTPTLFWMGATYAIQPFDRFLLDGLRPFAELMVGGVFEQGPIAHGSIGLTYRPLGPIAIMAGFNTSALFYRHDATWYSSTKWGMTYGLSIDLGRLP